MNDNAYIAQTDLTEEAVAAARQLILQAVLDEAEHREINLKGVNLLGVELGNWTVTISRCE